MSHDSAFSVVPYIVQTGDSVHALWFGGAWNGPNPAIKYGFGIQYSHSYDGGLNFSPQTELVSYDSASGSNGLIAVSGRYVYVLYGAIVPANPNYYRIAILRSTNAGISWEPHIFLGDYYRWAIAARDSSVYVYFGYLDSNRIKAGILVSKDYGVNWTILNDSILVSNQPAPLIVTRYGLHLAAARRISSGGPYYDEVFYTHSTDFGTHWSTPQVISADDGIYSNDPQLAGDDSGNVYIIWNDAKYGSIDSYHASILMRKSGDNGQTWGPEQLLTYTPTAIQPHFSGDDSKLVVSWNEYIDFYHDRTLLRVVLNDGATICDTIAANAHGGDADVNLDGNYINVVWYMDDGEVYRHQAAFKIDSARVFSSTVGLTAGWNLISVPVRTSDGSKSTLFPSAISPAFQYDSSGYEVSGILDNGRGYWLKFAGPEMSSIRGTALRQDSIVLRLGWNMIGSIDVPVPVAMVTTLPGGIISSRFFRYENGYRAADTLYPGSGYWVKAKSGGKLIQMDPCDSLLVQSHSH